MSDVNSTADDLFYLVILQTRSATHGTQPVENAVCFPSHIAEKPITTASQKTLTASGAHWTKIMISTNDLDFVVREDFLFRIIRVNVFVSAGGKKYCNLNLQADK